MLLGKTRYSVPQCLSIALSFSVSMSVSESNALSWTGIAFRGEYKYSCSFHIMDINAGLIGH